MNDSKTFVQDVLEIISTVFAINDEDIAATCRVPVETLMEWRDQASGIDRTIKGMPRLLILYQAALNGRNAGYRLTPEELRRPVFEGRSLHEYLMGEPINSETIQFIVSRVQLGAINKTQDPFR